MTRVFVPWRDDCVLPEESLYSHVSKLAWFRTESPVVFLRRFHEIGSRSPKLNLLEVGWISALQRVDTLLLVYGKTVREHLAEIANAEDQELPCAVRSCYLRVCNSCLNGGIHLRLHQNLLLERCPIHDEILSYWCPHCGEPLRLTLSTKAKAFCCTQCLAQLVSSDKFGEPRTVSQRSALRSATNRMHGPLQFLCAWMKRHTGHALSVHHSSQDIDFGSLWLEALCRHTAVPPEVRRTEWPQARLGFQTLGAMDDVDKRGVLIGDVIDRLSCSVYRWFLRRRGCAHKDCLDTPVRLFADTFNDDARHPEDLLECCPVAVGFWIWRRSIRYASPWWARTLLRESRPAQALQRATYKAIKSHLQYCLYMAKYIADSVPKSGVDMAIDELRRLFFIHARDFLGYCVDGSGAALEFDLDEDFSCWRCKGYAAYENRLMENLRWTMLVSRQGITYLDRTAEYDACRVAPGIPFTWMRGEEHRFRAGLLNGPAYAFAQ